MSTLAFLGLMILGSIWIVGLMLFSMGLMHGYLRDKRETFGAQVNDQLAERLNYLEERIDAAITANH